MPISTVWILNYVQQCYVKWFWTIASLGAPDWEELKNHEFSAWLRSQKQDFDESIVGFHMTSLKFKLKNYRSYRDFTFTMH